MPLSTLLHKEEHQQVRNTLVFQMLREVRGLVFHAQTKQILSRPLHKFFNLNEMPETSIDRVSTLLANQQLEQFEVLEKMDGMMIG